jgi:hypothetical protein
MIIPDEPYPCPSLMDFPKSFFCQQLEFSQVLTYLPVELMVDLVIRAMINRLYNFTPFGEEQRRRVLRRGSNRIKHQLAAPFPAAYIIHVTPMSCCMTIKLAIHEAIIK